MLQDNRFIIKELTMQEFEWLQEFMINYINYVTSSIKEQVIKKYSMYYF